MRLSSLQYSLLRKMPDECDVDLALRYKQTTFGSLGRRGMIKKVGKRFVKTTDGKEALFQFGREEVFRKSINGKLSIHFREHLRLVRKSA